MKSDLSSFSARLRSLIADHPAVPSTIPFHALALELFALQYQANAAYRKICDARRVTPLTVSKWTDIPSIPTSAFKELDLTCLPPDQRSRVFHSSGTTAQQPSRHLHNSESLAVYETSLWSWFAANVLCPGHPAIQDWQLVILTPSPNDTPHSSLVYMLDVVRQKFGAGMSVFHGTVNRQGDWELDGEAIVARLQATTGNKRPVLVLGTAFAFVHLLDYLADAKLRFELPAGSRVMETGGYKGRSREIPKPELHAEISRRFGLPTEQIICEYGMSELSSQAYDEAVAANNAFRFPHWARAQIISPETGLEVDDGETGLIRIFDLANVWSVMAVQTEDLGIRRGEGFELLGRASLAEPRGCSRMTA